MGSVFMPAGVAVTTLCAIGSATLGTTALAQTMQSKTPIAQYSMDVATMTAPGHETERTLALYLSTSRKPAGTQAVHFLPKEQVWGPSLLLIPQDNPNGKANTSGRSLGEDPPLPPKGRVLLYWGCSEIVREGQPLVIDMGAVDAKEYAKFMPLRGMRDRAMTTTTGVSTWPNTKSKQNIPIAASLVGAHAVSGEGVPPTLQFAIPEAYDFMPPLALSSDPSGPGSTRLSWTPLPHAQAYFLSATGRGETDTVLWTSSEDADAGWGLMDYQSPALLEKWLSDKVVLNTTQTQCTIPDGIFSKTEGATVQGIAYGPELNVTSTTSRATDRRAAAAQDWSVRLRTKSVAQLTLAKEVPAPPKKETVVVPELPKEKPLIPTVPGVPNMGNLFKGLFGR